MDFNILPPGKNTYFFQQPEKQGLNVFLCISFYLIQTGYNEILAINNESTVGNRYDVIRYDAREISVIDQSMNRH